MFDVYLTTLTLEIDVGQGAARTLSADIYVNIQVNGNPTCLLEACDARMRGCEDARLNLLPEDVEYTGADWKPRTNYLASKYQSGRHFLVAILMCV